MGPYRGIVMFMGLACIACAFRDVLFLTMRLVGMTFMATPTASATTANEILALFLGVVGGGLLYAACHWMKPFEMPTVEEMADLLREDKDGDDDLEDLLDDLLPGKAPASKV